MNGSELKADSFYDFFIASKEAGVNLRTLQQYEIGSKDINKASGQAINSLAQALHCNFYDVMELDL